MNRWSARIATRCEWNRLIRSADGKLSALMLQDHAAMTHMPALLALAKYENVAVMATGVPGYSAQPYPYPIMQTYLRQVYDAFGPHRMLWGSVISAMPCSWRHCVTMFTEELSWLNEADKPLVMGEVLCTWSSRSR